MTSSETWYIVKQPAGNCEIIPSTPNPSTSESSTSESLTSEDTQERNQWGPFASQGEAIARRIGLIRSGKCQPL